jgi:hypothetical protein
MSNSCTGVRRISVASFRMADSIEPKTIGPLRTFRQSPVSLSTSPSLHDKLPIKLPYAEVMHDSCHRGSTAIWESPPSCLEPSPREPPARLCTSKRTKDPHARDRSSVASTSDEVKRRLIALWHQSLANIEKSRS